MRHLDHGDRKSASGNAYVPRAAKNLRQIQIAVVVNPKSVKHAKANHYANGLDGASQQHPAPLHAAVVPHHVIEHVTKNRNRKTKTQKLPMSVQTRKTLKKVVEVILRKIPHAQWMHVHQNVHMVTGLNGPDVLQHVAAAKTDVIVHAIVPKVCQHQNVTRADNVMVSQLKKSTVT